MNIIDNIELFIDILNTKKNVKLVANNGWLCKGLVQSDSFNKGMVRLCLVSENSQGIC